MVQLLHRLQIVLGGGHFINTYMYCIPELRWGKLKWDIYPVRINTYLPSSQVPTIPHTAPHWSSSWDLVHGSVPDGTDQSKWSHSVQTLCTHDLGSPLAQTCPHNNLHLQVSACHALCGRINVLRLCSLKMVGSIVQVERETGKILVI